MSDDLLQRRANIIAEYPNTRHLVDRIIELEDSASNYVKLNEELEHKIEMTTNPCRFPEHRDPVYGSVTHMRYLMQVDDGGFYLECCEVCGTVRGQQAVPIA